MKIFFITLASSIVTVLILIPVIALLVKYTACVFEFILGIR